MNSKEWKKWLFWFSFAVATVVVYKTIDSFAEIFTWINDFLDLLMPFLLAMLVAYILYIPCRRVENFLKSRKSKFVQKHARGFSVLFVYVVTILLIFISIKFILPSVSESVTDLANNIPNYYNNAINYLNNVEEESLLYKLNVKEYVGTLQEIKIEQEIIKWINIEMVVQYIQGLVGATNMIFDAFVTFVVSIYMLLERSDIKSFLHNLSKAIFDKKTNETISKYYNKSNEIFFTFITSQIIDAFIVGIVTSIVMNLMNVKYAMLLGFVIGLFNIIPYFGAIVAVIIAISITFFSGGLVQGLWVAVVITALQQVDANIINPRILGTSLDLSPILVIFSVTCGGKYFGPLGMFLGVPVCAFIKLILIDLVNYKNAKDDKFNSELVERIESL